MGDHPKATETSVLMAHELMASVVGIVMRQVILIRTSGTHAGDAGGINAADVPESSMMRSVLTEVVPNSQRITTRTAE